MVEMFKLVVVLASMGGDFTPTQVVYYDTIFQCLEAGAKLQRERPLYSQWRCDAVMMPTTVPPKK
jgi:hypothetical protein